MTDFKAESQWNKLDIMLSYAKGQYPIVFFETPDVDFADFFFEHYLKARTYPLTDESGALSKELIDKINSREGVLKFYFINNFDSYFESNDKEKSALASAVLTKYIDFHKRCKEKSNNLLILTGKYYNMPSWVTPYVRRLDVPYPDIPIILYIMESICFLKENTMDEEKQFWTNKAKDFRGFTIRQIQYVLSCIKIDYSKVGRYKKEQWLSDKSEIEKNLRIKIRELKEQVIRDNKAVKFIEAEKVHFEGCNNVTDYIRKIKPSFAENVSEYVSAPKGLLFAGVPGTGKSLLAKHIADELKLNLLQLDMGSLMGKYVGESEQHLRDALKLAEAVSPVVLWIDEMDKSVNTNSNHDTSQRMYAYLLNWMQECKKPVFIYATGNHIEKFDGALIRSGRFDAKFFAFMPSFSQCSSIFDACIRKRQKNGKVFFCSEKQDDELLHRHIESLKRELFLHAAERGKFMTGADIDSWVQMTLNSLITKEDSNAEPPYDADLFMAEMEKQMEFLSPYGKTSMIEIADYFLTAEYNSLTPASKPIFEYIFNLQNKSPDNKREQYNDKERHRTMLEKTWESVNRKSIEELQSTNEAFSVKEASLVSLWAKSKQWVDSHMDDAKLPTSSYFEKKYLLVSENNEIKDTVDIDDLYYSYDILFYRALVKQIESFSYEYICNKFVEKK